MTSYITNADFIVIEQTSRRDYNQHVFDSEEQFKEWRQLPKNRWKVIVARVNARGRMGRTIDHRFCPVEWEL
jgi:hypothetical protein